jgi:hypothetical protein
MPATRALPLLGWVSVVRTRTAVDFPAPLGPSRPKMVPASTDRLSPSSARTSGESILTSSFASIATSIWSPRSVQLQCLYDNTSLASRDNSAKT